MAVMAAHRCHCHYIAVTVSVTGPADAGARVERPLYPQTARRLGPRFVLSDSRACACAGATGLEQQGERARELLVQGVLRGRAGADQDRLADALLHAALLAAAAAARATKPGERRLRRQLALLTTRGASCSS
jgi:hypothetical protein